MGRPAPAGRVLEAIAGETIEVEVEGTPGRLLAGDGQALEGAAPTGSVRLLPGFDPYVMGFHPREHLLPPEHSARVFRQAGWVTPTLLVDGRVEGVWGHDRVGRRIEVTVEPWGAPPPPSGARWERRSISSAASWTPRPPSLWPERSSRRSA